MGRHYAGTYQSRRRWLLRTVTASSRCWRCGRLLAEHEPHANGRRPFWTAGHLIDSDPNSPLALEASTCNMQAGGRLGNERKRNRRRRNGNPTSRRWLN